MSVLERAHTRPLRFRALKDRPQLFETRLDHSLKVQHENFSKSSALDAAITGRKNSASEHSSQLSACPLPTGRDFRFVLDSYLRLVSTVSDLDDRECSEEPQDTCAYV